MIDSHAHLTSSDLYGEVEDILSRTDKLQRIVNIATDIDSLIKGIELKKKYSKIFNTCATTPHDVKGDWVKPEALLPFRDDIVAIGETGLDYFYEHSPKDLQKQVFITYLKLAKEWNKPVVIHCRDAFSDLFDIMDNHFAGGRAILHCFTGTLDEAKEGLKRGYLVSFSGIVTFKKSVELCEVAKEVPLNSMLIETDCPYLAPQPYRGRRNEPMFLEATCAYLARLKEITFDQMALETARNAENIFAFH